MKRPSVIDVASVLFAAIALVGTFAFTRRAFGDSNPPPPPSRRTIKGGREFASAGQRLGSTKARVVIVEFSDFQCPFCRRLQNILAELRSRHPEDVSIVFRHYPLRSHPLARPAAIASECAGVQGRFEEFSNLLFQRQDSIGLVSWQDFAARSKVSDADEFKRCLSSSTAHDRVAQDISAGSKLQLEGTPALIVGDELLLGAMPLDSLERMLRLAPTSVLK